MRLGLLRAALAAQCRGLGESAAQAREQGRALARVLDDQRDEIQATLPLRRG